MKRHRNSGTKTGNREPQQNYRLGTVSNELLGAEMEPFFQVIPGRLENPGIVLTTPGLLQGK